MYDLWVSNCQTGHTWRWACASGVLSDLCGMPSAQNTLYRVTVRQGIEPSINDPEVGS